MFYLICRQLTKKSIKTIQSFAGKINPLTVIGYRYPFVPFRFLTNSLKLCSVRNIFAVSRENKDVYLPKQIPPFSSRIHQRTCCSAANHVANLFAARIQIAVIKHL